MISSGSILSLRVQTLYNILLFHTRFYRDMILTVCVCGLSTWPRGWERVRGMALSLPQPIRTWLTSLFSVAVPRRSSCLILTLNELNFSTSLESLKTDWIWGCSATGNFWTVTVDFEPQIISGVSAKHTQWFFFFIHIQRCSVKSNEVYSVLACLWFIYRACRALSLLSR